MRSCWSRWLTSAVVVSTLALLPRAAAAQTAVLSSPPDSSELRELRVAVSSTGQSAVWFSVRMFGGSDDVYLVVPAPEGSAVDTSSDAWFEALAAATNTRVVPPAKAPLCAPKPAPGAFETIGEDTHTHTEAPDGPAEVLSFAQVIAWAQNHGLLLGTDQIARLIDLELLGHRFVALRISPPAGESSSRTLRVAPASAHSAAPLLLSRAGSTKVLATVWHFATGRAWPKTLSPLTLDASKLLWTSTQSRSNYPARWQETLAAVQGQGWVIDAASHDILFQSTPIVSGAALIPSVGSTYFERAAGYGDGEAGWAACAARFASLQQSPVALSDACGRGEIAWIGADGGAGCVEHAEPGELDPNELRCGPRADDLAIALSGARPSEVWLTRWTGYIPAWATRTDESFEVKAGPVVSPVVTSSGWETDCEADGGQGGGSGQGAGGSGGSGNGGGYPPGGGNGYGGANGGPQDPGAEGEEDCVDCGGISVDPGVVAEASCSGDSSSSSSDDSCSGDSSSSSSGDSCDGDSSESGGESCDGDSSQSGGDSCDGDSSQSGGDSCDGDTSGGGESCDGGGSTSGGSSCSGGSSSGGSDCSVAKGRGRKPPMSGVIMGVVALMLPLRRWRRR